jgi:hypothetical protein
VSEWLERGIKKNFHSEFSITVNWEYENTKHQISKFKQIPVTKFKILNKGSVYTALSPASICNRNFPNSEFLFLCHMPP